MKDLSNRIYTLGLVGWPLGHSVSPELHKAALKAAGLQGSYRLYPCPQGPESADIIENLLKSLRCGDLHGLNVTIPYKQTALTWVDETTPLATSVGAVNTLFLREGRLVGDNTDGPGFLADLTQPVDGTPLIRLPVSGETALILGAGGAARSAAAVLAGLGMKVFIASRTYKKAEELAEKVHFQENNRLKTGEIVPIPFKAGTLRDLTPVLIVNATPAGMFPDEDRSPWPESISLLPGTALYDMVYNPLETVLVRVARASGLRAVGGLGMLVEQAALSFESWTGVPASRRVMFAAARLSLSVPAEVSKNNKKDVL
jgi:shikimate dehydrogenase